MAIDRMQKIALVGDRKWEEWIQAYHKVQGAVMILSEADMPIRFSALEIDFLFFNKKIIL